MCSKKMDQFLISQLARYISVLRPNVQTRYAEVVPTTDFKSKHACFQDLLALSLQASRTLKPAKERVVF